MHHLVQALPAMDPDTGRSSHPAMTWDRDVEPDRFDVDDAGQPESCLVRGRRPGPGQQKGSPDA